MAGYSGGVSFGHPPVPSRGSAQRNSAVPPKPSQSGGGSGGRGQRPSSSKPATPKPSRGNVGLTQFHGGPKTANPNAKARAPRGPHVNTSNTGGQFGNPLYDPSQTLSGKSLAQAAQAIADAQTKGPIAEAQSQIAQNNQTSQGVQKQDFGYYMQLAQDAQNYVNQQPAQGLQQAAAFQNINNQTQNQLGQIGQNAQQGLDRFPGAGGQAAQAINQQTAQQQQTATLGQQAAANYVGQTTNAANLAARNQLGSIAQSGQDAIRNVALRNEAANEPLTAKIAGLDAQSGSLKATALGQLRTAERNYQLAQEGLGVKQQGQQLTANTDRQRILATLQGQKLTNQAALARIEATLRGQNITAKTAAAALGERKANDYQTQLLRKAQLAEKTHNDAASQAYKAAALATRSSGGGSSKPLTTLEQDKAYHSILAAVNTIKQRKALGKNGDAIRQGLQSGNLGLGKLDPRLVNAAFELAGWGYITPGTARQLRAMGLRGTQLGQVKLPPLNKAAQGISTGAATTGITNGNLSESL